MAGEWFLVGLTERSRELGCGQSWHSYIKDDPCLRLSVCVHVFLSPQPSSQLMNRRAYSRCGVFTIWYPLT